MLRNWSSARCASAMSPDLALFSSRSNIACSCWGVMVLVGRSDGWSFVADGSAFCAISARNLSSCWRKASVSFLISSGGALRARHP